MSELVSTQLVGGNSQVACTVGLEHIGRPPHSAYPREPDGDRDQEGVAEGRRPDHLDGAGLRHRSAVRADSQLNASTPGTK